MDKKTILKAIIPLLVLTGIIFFFTTNKVIPIPSNSLESFLSENNASEKVKEAYRFAQENPEDVLSKVKCYCGCLEQGHKNNHDCFINEDGTFDLMGLNCGLCVKTSLLSKSMLAEGKTIQEISNYIDTNRGKLTE